MVIDCILFGEWRESETAERMLTSNFEELVSNREQCFPACDLRNTNLARMFIDARKKKRERERGRKEGKERERTK